MTGQAEATNISIRSVFKEENQNKGTEKTVLNVIQEKFPETTQKKL